MTVLRMPALPATTGNTFCKVPRTAASEFADAETHQKAGCVVQETPETDGEAALEDVAVLG